MKSAETNFQIPVRVCEVREAASTEIFFVVTLSLYKNVTDAKLAICTAARNLAKHMLKSMDVFIRAPKEIFRVNILFGSNPSPEFEN